MAIYLIITGVILVYYLILSLYNRRKEFNLKFFFVAGSFLFLFLISSIRSDQVGADMEIYLNIFDEVKEHSLISIITDAFSFDHFGSTSIYNGNYEVGYIIFNKIVSTLSMTHFSFKLFSSAFILFPIAIFIYKSSNNVLISTLLFVLLGYYSSSYVILRQFMALSILSISLLYLNKDKTKFFVLVFIAFLFHKSSLVFLIVYLLQHFWPEIYKYRKGIIIVLIIGLVSSRPLILWLIEHFYPFYENKIVFGEGINLSIVYIVLLLITLVLNYRRINMFKSFQVSFVLFLVGLIIQLFTFQFSLLSRVALYFQFFNIVFIPNYLDSDKKTLNQLLIIFGALFFFLAAVCPNNTGEIDHYEVDNNISLYREKLLQKNDTI